MHPLPPSQKYRVNKEAREVFSRVDGALLLDSSLEAHAHMKEGGLDITDLFLLSGGMADLTRIILPSSERTKKMQNANEPGDKWVSKRYQVSLSSASTMVML
ncbi:hypothetical protein BDN67DRAFT_964900 [Paxillus ammoniavirescens]|nr:hypothetical protein BDN67DRAFT_964900 [Paxillus ammoniavirescens]